MRFYCVLKRSCGEKSEIFKKVSKYGSLQPRGRTVLSQPVHRAGKPNRVGITASGLVFMRIIPVHRFVIMKSHNYCYC
jgi:hypothetical protein